MEKKEVKHRTIEIGSVLLVVLLVLSEVIRYYTKLSFLLPVSITLLTTLTHFVLRLLIAALVSIAFTRKTNSLNFNNAWFREKKWEKEFYNFIKVKKWKSKMMTYDPSLFDLEKQGLGNLIKESCRAEVIHEAIAITSFLPLLYTFLFGTFPVFLITSIIATVYDMLFVFIQRFNRPRILKILERKNN